MSTARRGLPVAGLICGLAPLLFRDLPLQLLGSRTTAPMASHLDYIVRPVCADWCRAEPKPGEPPSPADHLAVIFDRGNCATSVFFGEGDALILVDGGVVAAQGRLRL